MLTITPFLWFDDQAEAAASHYASIFPSSKILGVARYGAAGPGAPGSVMTVEFQLAGLRITALNGGPAHAHFSEAFSFSVLCDDQEEVDRYWEALVSGGEPSRCGWLKDRFGFSWQIVPKALPQLLSDPDPARAQRTVRAMLQMTKLDVAALTAAADAAA